MIVVYLLTCNVCLTQYVGQTVEEFRYRWDNYKNNSSKYQECGTCMQQHFLVYFSVEGHLRRCLYYIYWQNFTHQTFYRVKTIEEVLWRQWSPGNRTLKAVSKTAFCFVFTTGFLPQIIIRTSFTVMVLVPIIIVIISITINVVAVFITALFLFLVSPWLCWCSSCHYYSCWRNCRPYCCHFFIIPVITPSLFCSF